MRTALVLLVITAISITAEDLNRSAVTLTAGIPGFVLPEIGYEYAFDPANRMSIALGTFLVVPEARISYIRLKNSFELMTSFGSVGALSDDDFGIASTDNPLVYLSATGGYRHTADNGFIFRLVGGGAMFFWDGGSVPFPFGQIGVGYGF